jgi:hypothetical protein
LVVLLFGFLFFNEGFAEGDHVEVGHDEEEKDCGGEEVDDCEIWVHVFAIFEHDGRPACQKHIVVSSQSCIGNIVVADQSELVRVLVLFGVVHR